MLTDFVEFVDNRAATLAVDSESGVVRGVKILGAKSSNGRTYTEAAMRGALPLYEGSAVFVDHRKPGEKGDRSYRDRFGSLKNVRVSEGSVLGDLSFNPSHPLAAQFAWDAKNSPESVGMSHDVTGRTSGSGTSVIVEAITAVRSVDLVASPATNKSLYESIMPTEPKTMDLATLRESHADLVAKLREEFITEQKTSAETKANEAKLQEALKELDLLKTEKAVAARKAAVEKAITEAGLPTIVVTETFRKLCDAAADDKALAELVEERKQLAGNVKANGPTWTKPVSKPADGEQITESDKQIKTKAGRFASLVS